MLINKFLVFVSVLSFVLYYIYFCMVSRMCTLVKCKTKNLETTNLKFLQSKQIFPARCGTCGKLMRKKSIRRHMYDVHYPTQQLPCDICHKLFKTANSLTTHLITIHRQLKSQRYNDNTKVNFIKDETIEILDT